MVCVQMVPLYMQGRRITVPEMSQKFNVNARTLTPALTRLVKSGVLNSKTGGTDRGYMLARHPKNISLYEIAHNIQGDLQMRCCSDVIDATTCFMSKRNKCLLYNKLNSVLLEVKNELDGITLYDQYVEGISNIK